MIFGLPRLYAALGAATLIAAFLAWVWRIDSLRAAYKRDLVAERASSALFAAKVTATSNEITRKATESARRVETVQAIKGQEISSAYQADLAALRARYDRLRNKTSGTNPGGSDASVPVVPNSPTGTDGATAPAPVNAFNAEANSIQLRALQSWVTGVSRGDGE